jgi:hypothetical protein
MAATAVCSKLRDAQRVFVRVFEPRYPRATRRVPNTELILVHSRVTFQSDVSLLKVLRRLNDVPDMPAQYGVFRRCQFLNSRNSQHRSSGIEYERKFVLANQPQTKSVTIESFGATRVSCGHKGHKLLRSENRFSLPRETGFLRSIARGLFCHTNSIYRLDPCRYTAVAT